MTATELPPIGVAEDHEARLQAALERHVRLGYNRQRVDRGLRKLGDRIRRELDQRGLAERAAFAVCYQQRGKLVRELGKFDGGAGGGAGRNDIELPIHVRVGNK